MVNRRLVMTQLAELAERVARAQAHAKPSAEALAADRDAFDLVSFNLMLAVQSCASVASHLIADEGWAPTSTVAASFARLAEHDVIRQETAQALTRAVGLRNVVAHGYAKVDPQSVHAAVTVGISDLDAFAAEVAAWLVGRT